MEETIEREVRAFCDTEANRMKGKKFFSSPLVGFADAEDPLFLEFKKIIGGFHLTPGELFENEFGPGSFNGGTVVSWVLPITPETVQTNRIQEKMPSREWAYTRWYGEKFIDKLREHMVSYLTSLGYRSLSPPLSSQWKRFRDSRVGWTSTWSERHAAFAAGLGTFSLSDGLITKKGIAHRCGSLITALKVEPTVRSYQGPYDYCLFYQGKECGICIDRCPGGAISERGHDKDLCEAYTHAEVKPQENFGVKTAGCGLCQTGIPCEGEVPGQA